MTIQCEKCEGIGYITTICSNCNGSGMPKGWNDRGSCRVCKGSGGGEAEECEDCNATGQVEVADDEGIEADGSR